MFCPPAALSSRFDAPDRIIRETKHSEGTMDALRAAGAALGSVSFPDADAAAGVFSAIAPACVTMFKLEELTLMTEAVAAAAAGKGQ